MASAPAAPSIRFAPLAASRRGLNWHDGSVAWHRMIEGHRCRSKRPPRWPRGGTRMPDPLQFDRLLRALADSCTTDRGVRAARDLRPASDVDAANARLDRVAATRPLLHADTAPALPARLDFAVALAQADRGASLEATELHAISRLARAVGTLRLQCRAWPPDAAALAAPIGALADPGALAELLDDAVDAEGRILDTASPTLARLRAEVVQLSARMRRRIEELVKATDDDGVLQDDYWTLRDDRYVLPVRAADQRALRGIVHGVSNTGQTVYVEPEEMVAGNNQLALLFDAVRREEQRILAALSGLCAAEAEPLETASAALADLDLALAAGRLGQALGGHRPHFGADRIELPGARHPLLLLDGTAVVANDVALVLPCRWLVVSGPNGGGKTVLLATVGLCALLARHGLFVPAGADAVLPWLDAVLVVLGDAQDLDRGLSTFEGHLRALQTAYDGARANAGRTLVLIDELASGTEPAAGSALGTAVLEAFATEAPAAFGVVTTHFETVKLLALRDPTFANAGLAADPQTQRPTWRLQLGAIGASNPLALAARVGLDPAIVARAHALAGGPGGEVAAALARLDDLRALLHQQVAEIETQRLQLDRARSHLEDQRQREAWAADRRVERAAAEALETLQEVQREVETARTAARSQDRHAIEQAAGVLSARAVEVQRLAQRASQRSAAPGPQRAIVGIERLAAGQLVWHAGLARTVSVIDIDVRGRRARVRAGSLESWVAEADLLGAKPGDADADRRVGKAAAGHVQAVASVPEAAFDAQSETLALRAPEWTCDVRGQRADEALLDVDRWLDRATLAGAAGICVVHGHGTGALRDAVRRHLRGHLQVHTYRPGKHGEGGDGATMVWTRR
ncbi:MAG: hypothetical protein EXR79_08050 [Myxococcales bacterium]|nr:hypothetical protein [Myxococcales bacterium]